MKYASEYAVVIPAYNEVGTLRAIVQQCLDICDTVIVVDDASTDGTANQIQDLPVSLLQHECNQGKAASLWDGIQCALKRGAKYIISLDADGQHLPQDIPEFIKTSRQLPNQIIIGSRLAEREAIPPRRYYANKVANFWISWACGYSILDSQSGFRLYPASLFEGLQIKVNRERCFVFESEILIKAAQKGIKSTPIKIAAIYAQDARPSHFRPVLDIVRITRMVAWSLISRLGYLPGFYSAFIKPLYPYQFFATVGLDGFAMLLLSILVIILSQGVSYLLAVVYCFYIARRTQCAASGFNVLAVFGMKLADKKIAADYQARLDRAIQLHSNRPDIKILIMGGITTPNAISEAEAGRQYLMQHGIDPSVILTEDKSRNTLENLQNALGLLAQLNTMDILVISNRYHLARVAALAKSFGYHSLLCPAEDKLKFSFKNIFALCMEGFYLHWYYTGKVYSHLTRNRKMLARISK